MLLIKKLFVLSLSIVFLGNVFSQTRIPSEKPKLVVGIIIENMRSEYLTLYANKFGKGGFRKLINEGTYFKNTEFDYLITQSGPGVTSMMTGCSPSVHGIVANFWYDRIKNEFVDCCFDKNAKITGSNVYTGNVSPSQILTSSFTDELISYSMSKSKVVSISPDYRAAVLAGGHMANSAYWFDAKSGDWVTSSYYMQTLPLWVNDFNIKNLPETYILNEWNTSLPIENYTESLPDENKYEKGFIKDKITFPYNLEKLYKEKSDFSFLMQTPYGNTLTKDFALDAIVKLELGKDDNPDVLMISFSAFREIEAIFGPKSVELEDAYIKFDKEIEHLLSFIDTEIGRENSLLFITSDCNGMPNQEYLSDNKFPVNSFDAGKSTVLLKAYLNAVYGAGDWVLKYDNRQIYLNRPLIEDAGLSLAEVSEKTVQLLLQMSGVTKAISATDLQRFDYTSGVFSEIQNSYYPKRSGDVFIFLEPGWTENNTGSLNSKSYKSDPVPLIWYGWKVKRGIYNRKISITDIAPTISGFLDIPYPNGCEGSIIPELLE